MSLLAGAGANVLGGVLGGNASKKAAAQAAAAQQAMYEKNIALLESVGIPSIEAQEIALNNPEYVGDLVAEAQGESALTEIATDPILRQNQMNALAQTKELSEQGLSTVDRIAMDEANQEATQADKGRRAQILSQMAQRGTADSGVQLAMQLASAQDANQNANQAANNVTKNAYNNRIAAMNNLASQSAGMEQADYGRQAQAATAQDAIQRFNVGTRNQVAQQNQANRQNIANQTSTNANQQEMYNKGLLQQDYNNRLSRAQSQVGLNTSAGNNQAQNALTAGAGKANMYSSIGQGLGNAATAYGSYSAKQPNPYGTATGMEDDRDEFNRLKG